jgi:hypothetical protein
MVRKKKKRKFGGKQPGAGRPKKLVTPEELEKAGSYAFEGCQNNTICTLMGWDDNFIDQRKDLREFFTKKRAERKLWLKKQQNKTAKGKSKSAATMQIFLGKNELDQTDHQKIDIGGRVKIILEDDKE